MLTDRGSCFVADAFEAACRRLKVEHRTTRPYTPRTNGMVERFNGRVQREVLGITIHSHRDLETLLHGFNHACNARRQRVLGGVSPDEAVRRRLQSNPRLNSRRDEPPSDPCVLPKALTIVEAAKDVSDPDNLFTRISRLRGRCARERAYPRLTLGDLALAVRQTLDEPISIPSKALAWRSPAGGRPDHGSRRSPRPSATACGLRE